MYHFAVTAFTLLLMIGPLGCREQSPEPFNRTCRDDGGSAAVSEPRFVRNLSIGNTGWFLSPAVYDLDGDGNIEIVVSSTRSGQPTVYESTNPHVFVFEPDGSLRDGWPRYDTRAGVGQDLPGGLDANCYGHSGFGSYGLNVLPLTDRPRPNNDWYPPGVIPSPALVNIEGDSRLEILTPSADGYIYAFAPDAKLLWRYRYARGLSLAYASEIAVADLSRDGRPEIIFGVYGEPGGERGRLIVLASNGELLHDIKLPGQRPDSGNGVGPCATPTVADLDGDGTLEILVMTIDHGLDVFTVEGSGCNCSPTGADPDLYCGPWPTGRGNYLRNGRMPGS